MTASGNRGSWDRANALAKRVAEDAAELARLANEQRAGAADLLRRLDEKLSGDQCPTCGATTMELPAAAGSAVWAAAVRDVGENMNVRGGYAIEFADFLATVGEPLAARKLLLTFARSALRARGDIRRAK